MGSLFAFANCIIIVSCSEILKYSGLETNTFQINYKDISFKLTSNEQIDGAFLSQIFNVKKEKIAGLQMADGLLLRLSNDKIQHLVNGKIVTLIVMEQEYEEESEECSNLNIASYGNTKPSDIKIVSFFSDSADDGKHALEQMREWLKDSKNQHVAIIDIKNNYLTYPNKFHNIVSWYHVFYKEDIIQNK